MVIPELRAIEPSWMSTEARISADWFGLGVIRDVISGVTLHAPAVRPCIAVTSLRSCAVSTTSVDPRTSVYDIASSY